MKRWKMGLLAGAALVLAGCSHDNAQTTEENVPTEEMAQSQNAASIKDAMTSGAPVQCTYPDPANNGYPSLVTLQGEKFRAVNRVGEATHFAVFDGTTYYMWMEGSKEGMKMTKACMEEMAQSVSSEQSREGFQNPTQKFENITEAACREDQAPDLSVPSDVAFTDQCEMLKQTTQMMQPNPAGQDMMQQYQQGNMPQ